MPVYAYKGLDARGKNTTGVRDAESPRKLRRLLRKEGVFVTDLSEERERVVSGKGLRREVDIKGVFDRVKPQDIAILTRQLATLIKAGIPLAEALAALVEQATSPKLQRILAEVRTKVNEGQSLGDAFGEHPKVFPPLYVNMVRAGEASGNLDQVLRRLTDFLDNQVKLKAKVTGAMVYPIVMAVVGILITGMLMVVVVPKITEIFDDLGKALPWNTQLLIFVSRITGDYWWALIIVTGGLITAFIYWKKSPNGKPRWDALTLKLWVVGPLIRMIAISRFARTLGTLLHSGVPLLEAMEIVKHLLGNEVLIQVVEDARVAIREGESIATQLAKSGHFPPMVTRMIAVGERAGELEEMLENVAQAYETEVDLKIERLMTLMEPMLILAMGGIIGFIVFSILMPILEMNELIG
jgi:general secretion pathway protein F